MKMEMPRSSSPSTDEFGEAVAQGANKALRTGRQRKKLAARLKGGEFMSRRKKRRVYFCCVSSEINVDILLEAMEQQHSGWQGKMYNDVLHFYTTDCKDGPDFLHNVHESLEPRSESVSPRCASAFDFDLRQESKYPNLHGDFNESGDIQSNVLIEQDSAVMLWNSGGKEVFIFNFGAIVFWGFHKVEEISMLNYIRESLTEDLLPSQEFRSGEDDMAYVISYDQSDITITNDVIVLPDEATPKQRLSVSYAIAQSSVLAIFEARIERRVEEYKFIPETLAVCGRVRLSPKQLGSMIGDVFVMRHDVNLNSEILDTPDMFWREDAALCIYRMTMNYLEMSNRTEVLNTRLNMVKELMAVLQQQHENAHNVHLEWIIIWLIVVSVVIELCVALGRILGL